MHDTPTLQGNKTCREDSCIWYVTTPGLSHPFWGMGPGSLELGKSVVFWIKLEKKCNFLHVCITFLLLDFQKSSHEMILMNTHNMFLYGDIQKIILHYHQIPYLSVPHNFTGQNVTKNFTSNRCLVCETWPKTIGGNLSGYETQKKTEWSTVICRTHKIISSYGFLSI